MAEPADHDGEDDRRARPTLQSGIEGGVRHAQFDELHLCHEHLQLSGQIERLGRIGLQVHLHLGDAFGPNAHDADFGFPFSRPGRRGQVLGRRPLQHDRVRLFLGRRSGFDISRDRGVDHRPVVRDHHTDANAGLFAQVEHRVLAGLANDLQRLRVAVAHSVNLGVSVENDGQGQGRQVGHAGGEGIRHRGGQRRGNERKACAGALDQSDQAVVGGGGKEN